MARFAYNTQHSEEGVLFAVCDRGILGDVYREDGKLLALEETYYGGSTGDFAAVETHWAAARMITAAGPDLINLLAEHGYIEETSVKTVEDVPFIHVYTLPG